MIALVTGGAGFIGTNLCIKLLELDYDVLCIDNLYSGCIENIKHLKSNSKFKFINHDVRLPYFFQCDIIFNLACPASPPFYLKDPIYTLETCFLGTQNALECAKKYNAKVFHASTSEIYGNPLIHPLPETYLGNVNTIGIRSCYDEGKRISETLCSDYYKLYGVLVYIARIFNTYGPYMRQDDGRIITLILTSILNNTPIPIYGDGSQTRSFLYVDDLINGILKLVESDYHQPVNLGNPEEYTIKECVTTVQQLFSRPSTIIYKDLPSDDPLLRKPDITTAISVLKWKPLITFKYGIIKMITIDKKYNTLLKSLICLKLEHMTA